MTVKSAQPFIRHLLSQFKVVELDTSPVRGRLVNSSLVRLYPFQEVQVSEQTLFLGFSSLRKRLRID